MTCVEYRPFVLKSVEVARNVITEYSKWSDGEKFGQSEIGKGLPYVQDVYI